MKVKFKKITIGIFCIALIFAFSEDYYCKIKTQGTKFDDCNPIVIEQEDTINQRKFSAFITKGKNKFITCWEEGKKELGNNIIKCYSFNNKFQDKREIKFNFNPNRRNIPIHIHLHKNILSLYYVEMDISELDKNKVKNTKLKKKKIDIRTNYEIGETELYGDEKNGFCAMSPYFERNNMVFPSYSLSQSKHLISLIYFKNDRLKKIEEVPNPNNMYLVEPCFVKFKNNKIVFCRNKSGFVNYSKFEKNKWSEFKISDVASPESIFKVVSFENLLIIVHNNIQTKSQGPRNSLDLTFFDVKKMKKIKTYNLLYHQDDFFSNFNLYIDNDCELYIIYQRLLRKNKFQNDRIELLKVNIKDKMLQ